MTTVTIEEAQARLPELVEKAAAGEQVVITRGDQPVAELTMRSATDQEVGPESGTAKSGFGCCKGMITYMADDFDAPLEDFKDYM